MTTIDIQDREDLIDKLEQTPLSVHAIMVDADEEALRKAGPGGSPGAVEVISYMRDFEDLFLDRIKVMIEDDNPRLERVEDSLWPIERDYVNQDPEAMLQDFILLRREAVQVLVDLPIGDWERLGRHPSLGQVTIRHYVERVLERDDEYVSQLEMLLGDSASENRSSQANS